MTLPVLAARAATAFLGAAPPDGITTGSAERGPVARVAVNVDPAPGPFDYLTGKLDVLVGSVVRVPLGGRRVRGVVLGFPAEPGAPKLRPLIGALGAGPAGDPILIALARWLAWRYITPLPVVLRRLVGPRLPERWNPPSHTGGPGYRALLSEALPEWPHLLIDPHRGGRAAFLARRPDRTPIAVVDPLDPAHRETAMPTFHALDGADARARLEGVTLHVVARLPGVAGRALAGAGGRRVETMARRRSWPLVEVIDRSREPPGEGPLSSRAVRALREAVGSGQRAFVFHNRVGLARALRCRGCGRVRQCATCGAAVGRAGDGGLECRRCRTPPPRPCPRCATTVYRPLGTGTAGLVRALEALLPGTEIARVDRESSGPPDRAPVVVGTQAAFAHDIRAAVVVVVDADSLELAPHYDSPETALWLMARAASAAGPRHEGGRALVQTHRPRSLVVQALVRGDSGRLDESEARVRTEAGLPPFGEMITVHGPAAVVEVAAADLPGAPAVLDGDRLVLAAPDLDPWRAALRHALDRHRPEGARIRVEVD